MGKKILWYCSGILCYIFIGFSILWYVHSLVKTENTVLSSPLPDFLTLSYNKQVSTLTLFSPSVASWSASIKKLDISAKAALVYDIKTDKALFAKNEKKRLPMASLTKIMTAIIALENKKSDDHYKVSKDDLVGEDSMGLSAGEVLTLEELLYGLMLVSGNDAAETLAHNYLFGREQFVRSMSDKAKSLGLTNTHFTNPSGLEGGGDQYTTAHDLLVITSYALENFEEFRTVVKTIEHEIPYSLEHKYFHLFNETNLLTSYKGVKGVKTGYTPEAGLCLVTYLEYKDHKIIGILLGSENRRQEMKELLDYSLKTLGILPHI